jgi:hypothetical protein
MIKNELQQRGHDPSLARCVVPFITIVEVAVATENINIIKEVFSAEVVLVPDNERYQNLNGCQNLSLLYQAATMAYCSFAYFHRYHDQQAKWAKERGLLFLKALRQFDEKEATNIQGFYGWLDKCN